MNDEKIIANTQNQKKKQLKNPKNSLQSRLKWDVWSFTEDQIYKEVEEQQHELDLKQPQRRCLDTLSQMSYFL